MKLEAQQLAYGYPGRRIGSDVSFTLNAGEVFVSAGTQWQRQNHPFQDLAGPVADSVRQSDA